MEQYISQEFPDGASVEAALLRAKSGGAIDIALQKKADLFKTIQMDGADREVTIPNTAGWYRLIEFGSSMQSAILHIKHQYYSSGPCDMLVYVSCYENYAVHILSATSYLDNVITIDDLRLVSNSTTRKYYLDIHYKFNSINGIGVDIIGTTAQVDWPVEITRMNLESVDTLPDGETVVKTAEWENPPMLLGVEYRTTERYLGKPVYVKVVDCGNLPASGLKNIAHGIANCKPIHVYGEMSNGNTLPYTTGTYFYISADGDYIQIYVTGNLSGQTSKATIKYTKTTD